MDNVEAQVLDLSGNWRTVAMIVNNAQRIALELRSLKLRYPDKRVRVIGKDGRLLDLMD